MSGWCGACQGRQGRWSTGGPCILLLLENNVKPPCVCVGGQAPVSDPGSELLRSQKERQWTLPACPTTTVDIFGNLCQSCSSFCKMSAGSWTSLCTYPRASFRLRMLSLDLGSLPLRGGGCMFPHRSVEHASPCSSPSPAILGIEY